MKIILILANVVVLAAAQEGYDYSPAVPPPPPSPSQTVVTGGYDDTYVPKIFKHAYVFTAPEEETRRENRVIRVPGGGDKHVNIIFVKTPSSSSSGQTEVILPEQDEHKNLVYVLLQNNQVENNLKITRPKAKAPAKPEVHFIRYADSSSSSAAAVPETPGGLYGTPQADPIELPQIDSAPVPPPKPSGLYGTPQADPVSVPAPPKKPSGLYGTPQASPVALSPPPKKPSGHYGLPSLKK